MLRILLSLTITIVSSRAVGRTDGLDAKQCNELLARARGALNAGALQSAAEAFDTLAHRCASVPDPSDHPYVFYSALARQLESNTGGLSRDRQSRLLAEAATLYEEALRVTVKPDRATLNNLGQVYAALGDNDRARNALSQAMAAGGDSDPWYMASYGRFLVHIGDIAEGKRYLAAAVGVRPDLIDGVAGLIEVTLREQGPASAIEQFRTIPDDREPVKWRTGIALIRGDGWGTFQSDLLAYILQAIAKDAMIDSTEGRQTIREQLDVIPLDSDLGPLAQEATDVLIGSDVTLNHWYSLKSEQGARPLERWTCFRTFAVSSAQAMLQDKQYLRAENIYRALLAVEADAFDVGTVRLLAETYAAAGDSASILSLGEHYDAVLSDVASTSPSLLRSRYDYHRELAALAGNFLRNSHKASGDTAAAPRVSADDELARFIIHEITVAERFAEVHNNTVANMRDQAIELDAAVPETAALAYGVLHDELGFARARLDAAEAYIRIGKPRTAAFQLDDLEKTSGNALSGLDRERLTRLRTMLPTTKP